MFDFYSMENNKSTRAIARYEDEDGLIIDTCFVTDSRLPIETAVSHPEYNDGSFIVVECYEDEFSALAGHQAWVNRMISDELPEQLQDVGASFWPSLGRTLYGDDYGVYKRTPRKE